jgi:hypothetical protein
VLSVPASPAAERDSLGRGLDPASIAVVVAKDRAVQQERAALVQYLRGAYHDPETAKAQLDERVKSQGWTSTAARLAQDSEQIGPLRGKLGLFAGARARAERATAERVARAAASALDRIAATEGCAAALRRGCRAHHDAHRRCARRGSGPAARAPRGPRRGQPVDSCSGGGGIRP